MEEELSPRNGNVPVAISFSTAPNENRSVRASGHVPKPLKPTFCGLPPPLSVMPRVALRLPVAFGAKVTVMVHEPAGDIGLLVTQSLAGVKSRAFVPLIAILVTVRAKVVLRFLTVTVADDFVPTFFSPNASATGDLMTMVPTPVRGRVTGFKLPSFVMARLALRLPGA